MTKLADRTEIPMLEGGWINLTEAAERLGYTRSYMYKKASKPAEEGGFETLRRIGNQASYIINESEIDEILSRKASPVVVTDEQPTPVITDAEPDEVTADIQPEEVIAGDREDAPVSDEQELSLEDIMSKIG